jgi:SAM-dependent methyltransferase
VSQPWTAYNELAWTEEWLADPADYEKEAAVYVGLMTRAASEPPRTLLHLGSGAGGHDRWFKRHFTVTGVDLSRGMLDRARAANPEITYVEGDMRTIRLHRRFDAVAIPDSIDYMNTADDLQRAVDTAAAHLCPGGVLLVTAKTRETFQNNNFAYTGEKDGVHVTLLENNYISKSRPHTYEATLIYLIRRNAELTIHTDHHVLGLFPQALWEKVFECAGFQMRQMTLDGIYDNWLLNDGEYPLTVFFGARVKCP